jgi:hypothetical protein
MGNFVYWYSLMLELMLQETAEWIAEWIGKLPNGLAE